MNQALGVGIVDFVRLPFGLNLRFLSPPQITILKAINGEPLTPEENVLFCKHSGKDRYDQKIVSNVNILTGRRSGKSTVINIKSNSIDLTNRCRILVLPADHTYIRGFASPFVILDENCFYGVDGGQINLKQLF